MDSQQPLTYIYLDNIKRSNANIKITGNQIYLHFDELVCRNFLKQFNKSVLFLGMYQCLIKCALFFQQGTLFILYLSHIYILLQVFNLIAP